MPARPTVTSLKEFADPGKSSFSQVAQMATFVLAMQLNLKDPATVVLVQTVFAVVASLVFLACQSVPEAVPTTGPAAEAPVWYPAEDPSAAAQNPLMALFSGGEGAKKATKWERLTLGELEQRLAQKKKTSAFSMLMPAFLSWFLKIHYLAASQVRRNL